MVMTYKDMMNEIRYGVNESGQPVPFNFRFVSADKRRKKAGEIIALDGCIYKLAKRKPSAQLHREKMASMTDYLPSLASGTMTIHTSGGRAIRICPRLIIEFNSKRIIY